MILSYLKSQFSRNAPNSNDLDFFQKLFFLRSQVGDKVANSKVSLKKIYYKGLKMYRQSVSFVDDTRSPRVNAAFG